MITKIKIQRMGRKAWLWAVTDTAGKHLAGGYAKTKADAKNDAGILAKAKGGAA